MVKTYYCIIVFCTGPYGISLNYTARLAFITGAVLQGFLCCFSALIEEKGWGYWAWLFNYSREKDSWTPQSPFQNKQNTVFEL